MSSDQENVMYVLINGYDSKAYVGSKEEVLVEAKGDFFQYLADFVDDYPLKVTEEVEEQTGVKVYALNADNREELPLQEWADAVYQNGKEYKEKEEERSYQDYLELHERFNERRLREEKEQK